MILTEKQQKYQEELLKSRQKRLKIKEKNKSKQLKITKANQIINSEIINNGAIINYCFERKEKYLRIFTIKDSIKIR